MLVAFMSLAFFYLVIGDLIVFHQKAIFNYDAFASQPLNKPGDKSDKSALYKLKDKKDRVILSLLSFISEHNQLVEDPFTSYCEIFLLADQNSYELNYLSSSLSYRGPPTL